MIHRDRFLAAINGRCPDKMPKYAEFTPQQIRNLVENTGNDDPAKYFDYEMREVRFSPTGQKVDYTPYLDDMPDGSIITEWGVGERPAHHYHLTEMVHPMGDFSTLEEVARYPWPDLMAPYRHADLEEKIVAVRDRGLATVSQFTTIFEQAWYLRGMERLLMDFFDFPEFANKLLDDVTEIGCFMAGRFAEAGVDLVRTGDDIGTQTGMLMSPEMWREWIKPRLARLINSAKLANPDVKVLYDSDGNFEPVVPDLIEIGVDVLAPVQPECNDPGQLKEKYGNQLSFWGSIGVQRTLPFGNPEDVKQEVQERVNTIGKDGGLVIAPSHVIPPEAPWENVLAFFEAVDEYGVYR